MTMELAGETRSDARVASEGPRATKKNATLAIARAIQRSRGTGPRPTEASRPGGLSYGIASRPGGLSYRKDIKI